MKLLKSLSVFIVALLLLSTKCKKNKTPGTVRGRIMLNCTTPLPNHTVKMRTNWGGGASFVEDVNGNTEFKTDSEGYFEINYITKGSEGQINVSGYSDVIRKIPIGEGLLTDVGEVNLNGKVNFVIRLQVNNPHTMYDTLVLRDWNNASPFAELRIPGPFTSGIIDTVWNESFMGYPLTYNKLADFQVNYILHPYVPGNAKTATFYAPFCSTSLMEALCIID